MGKRETAIACCAHCRKFLFPGDNVVMIQQGAAERGLYTPCCSVECAQAYINDLAARYERRIQLLRERNQDLKTEKL